MPTITVPTAPRLTRLGRGQERDAAVTDAAEQAKDVRATTPKGDESDALIEQAARSVRQAATLAAGWLLVAAIVAGTAVVLSRRVARTRAAKAAIS
ncbi:MAG TPA: hypothetical protein VIG77_01980 [Ktedonobacterales bacterium]|jgi:hypothetical protein